jgi:hypothetical protein
MKFLCLCYYNAAQFGAMSNEEIAAFVESCKPHDEELRRSALFAVGSVPQSSPHRPRHWRR